MNKSNILEQQFFKLLRAGLWETDVRLVSINDGDFAEIKRLAKEQSVEGMIAAGIEHVVDVELPEEECVKLVGKAWHLELQNAEMNDFIGKTVEEMRACGIKTLLVKGQGIALLDLEQGVVEESLLVLVGDNQIVTYAQDGGIDLQFTLGINHVQSGAEQLQNLGHTCGHAFLTSLDGNIDC